MHHGLLVAAREVPEGILITGPTGREVSSDNRSPVALHLPLHQRLTEPRDVAVAEDAEALFDQPLPGHRPVRSTDAPGTSQPPERRSAEPSRSLASTEGK